MRKATETYYCDMCGAEFDPRAADTIACSHHSLYIVPVYEHDPDAVEGSQDGIAYIELDLCPKCSDRACTILREWYMDEDGRWRSRLSWRERCKCGKREEPQMSETARRVFDRLVDASGGKEAGE